MLTHVHKVIHFMVGTIEQGKETPPASCTKKIGFHRVHRTQVSTGLERPVSGSTGRAFRSHDRMLGRSATGRWKAASGHADVAAQRKTPYDRTLDVSGQS